ncbi:cation:proton antiporter [Salibaculum sp.]|uniref:cation:proton antiporter n=1 Tax=Salibaculum sp. TaxID=2855480 RepID=UPI002B496B99|nr:cation:proton antiporter [Salibaculum sp.]HKL69746.1 cation:proton antiporter [Salibaculum sp.]
MTPEIVILAIGLLFLAGLALDAVGHVVHVPRVTLLILMGVIVGPPGLDWLPIDIHSAHEVLAPTALTMVAFLMGGSLDRGTLAAQGRAILVMSLALVAGTALVVGLGLWALGTSLVAALLLAGIATATAPAATLDVIREADAQTTPFGKLLIGIVAIDDAWGLLAFSLLLTLAATVGGNGDAAVLADAGYEIGGAVMLGLALGLPAAALTGRVKPGEPTLIEALGLVLVIAGLALWLDVSFLIAGMTAGALVTNLARHHDRPFHEIERIEWPFLLLFFVMAGASLDIGALVAAGWAGAAYMGLRLMGRLLGGTIGGPMAGMTPAHGARTAAALLPQAGVAVGMALVAAERFPQAGATVLAVTVASTVIFEVIGPPLTQWALAKENRPDG